MALTTLLAVANGCVDLHLPDPDVVYIAFGDSATDGPAERDYPDVLQELLGVPEEQFTKESAGGATIGEGVDRLRGLLADEIYPNAEVLLLWQGGADLIDLISEVDPFLLWSVQDSDYPYTRELDDELDRIRAKLEEAISLGKSAGLEVYVATYYPILGGFSACPAVPFDILLPGQAARANEYVALLNARIRQAAVSADAVLVDVAADANDLADDRDNYTNCNHLSAAGNARVAEVFFTTLDR